MTAPLYCSQYHVNPSGSRFCRFCGEALVEAVSGAIAVAQSPDQPQSAQSILGMRYRVLHLLGQGGFGRTYLAEDLNRFQEQCVLKEFVPLVQDADALRKAEELFQREAGVLYQLQHDQIPRFRELLRVVQNQAATLYLVQDYIPGSTYREILQERQREKRTFTEDEILDLFRQLLPVLQYLHNLRVIHRDIAPDNLILRETDNLPVLIDFGGVKQIAAQVEQQLRSRIALPNPTRLGKVGYAPDEQMQSGEVNPSSDLYALAVTALVLLTGQEPLNLYDPHTVTWHWRKRVQLSSRLSQVLDRMLAFRPSDRYQSATDVMQALGWQSPSHHHAQPSSQATPPLPIPVSAASSSLTGQATVAVSPRAPRRFRQSASPVQPHSQSKPKFKSQDIPFRPAFSSSSGGALAAIAPHSGLRSQSQRRTVIPGRAIAQAILFVLLTTGTAGSIWLVWWLVTTWEPSSGLFLPPVAVSSNPPAGQPDNSEAENSETEEPEANEPTYSPAERTRKAELRQRRERLGIDEGVLNTITNQLFFKNYPEKAGVQLTGSAADDVWRQRWDETAADVLKQMDDALSREGRQSLGSYDSRDRDQWAAEARTDHNVSDRALYDLTDAAFREQFPDFADELTNGALLDTSMGQVWHGMAFDRLRGFRDGEALEELNVDNQDSRTIKRQLQPGEGKIYLMELSDGQDFKVRLDAPDDEALLSIYPPRLEDAAPLQEDSDDHSWSGTVSQSGVYEVVVVSRSDDAFDYELQIEVNE